MTLTQIVKFYDPKIKEAYQRNPHHWDITVMSVGLAEMDALLRVAKTVLRHKALKARIRKNTKNTA